MPIRRTIIKKPTILHSVSALALAIGSFAAASGANAQQRTPGVSAECPIVAGVATCSGDIGGGINTTPGDPGFDTIIIENPTGPIAPPGFFGVGVVKDDRDITINIQDGVEINVFDDPLIAGPAQGVIAIVDNGFDLTIDSGANITADGNGSAGIGLEANTLGGGHVSVTNRGDIDAFTSGETAIALMARAFGGNGNITIDNSGTLTATSNGVGERTTITAGIFAFSDLGGNVIDVTNNGDISVTTGAASFDSDFNGVAGAIVTNVFGDASTTNIVNNGTLAATGPATSGIVGFAQNNSMTDSSTVMIDNNGAITVNGIGGYGILAQSSGTSVNLDVDNGALIHMVAPGGTATGIFNLNQAQNATSSIVNTGDMTGSGLNLRGLGISSFGAPAGGTYNFSVTNSGNFTFDSGAPIGISAFSTMEDDVTVTITNSGNFDFSSSTGALSRGISATFDFVDDTAMGADGTSNVTINNSGNIMMGAGNAIFAVADQVNLINTGNLSTTGDFSDVVRVEGIDADSDVDVTIGGDAIASGADSDAINITNAGSTTVTVSNGALVSSGTGDAFAIHLLGAQANMAGTDEITGEVTGSVGRLEQKFFEYDAGCLTGCTLTDIFAPIAPGNPDASAFDDVVNVDNATVESMMGAGAIDSSGSLLVNGMNGAVIRSGNNGAPVISAVGALGIVASDTTFSSMGDDAPLFSIAEMTAGDGTAVYVELTDVDASTAGSNSDAIVLSGGTGNSVATLFLDASDPMAPTSISTVGDNSRAIVFDAPGSSTFAGSISNSLITTLGDNADAVYLNVGDDGYLIAELLNTTIETSGDDSDAFDLLAGNNGRLDLLFGNTTFTTTGANSNGLSVSALGDNSDTIMRLINTIITTEGDGSAGISIADAGADSRIVVNFNNPSTGLPASAITGSEIRTMGDDAPGVSIGQAKRTSVSLRDAIISTSGMGVSPAISLAGSTEIDAQISSSISRVQASTVADNSAAFELQNPGGEDSGLLTGSGNSQFSTEGDSSDAYVIGSISSLQARSSITNTHRDSEFVTRGDNSRGIYINARDGGDGGDVAMIVENSTFMTEGNGSTGILLDLYSAGMTNARSTVAIADSVFSTIGNDAHGIEFVRLTGGMEQSFFIFGFADSQVSTSGDNAYGVYWGGIDGDVSDSDITLAMENITATTSGAGSHGIFLGGISGTTSGTDNDGDPTRLLVALEALDITTSGAGAGGIVVGDFGPDGRLDFERLNNSVIATSGDDAPGVSLGAVRTGNVTLDNATITASGMGVSPGLLMAGSTEDNASWSIILSNSQFSTASDSSAAVDLQNLGGEGSSNAISGVNSQFSTQGDASDAFAIGSASSMQGGSTSLFNFDNLDLTTMGNDSRGLFLNTADGGNMGSVSFTLTNSTFVTEGSGSTALLIDSFSAGAADADFSTLIEDNVVSTAGNAAHGIELADITGDVTGSTFSFIDLRNQTTTAGDGAHGFAWDGISGVLSDSSLTLVIGDAEVTTSGAGSHGVMLGDLPAFAASDGSNSTLALGFDLITTSGDGSHGLVIGQGWGSAGASQDDAANGVASRFNTIAVNGSLMTQGMGSHGILSSSIMNELFVTTGSTVTSANGDAITLEQGLGIGFENLNNSGTIEALSGAAIRADLTAGFADMVTNEATGVIMGDVLLGAGSDVYTGEAGSSLVGTLDMGTGDDVVNVTELVADAILLGGDGMDILNLTTGDGETLTVEMDNIQVGGFESYRLLGTGTRSFTGDSLVIRNMELLGGTLNIEGLIGGTNLVTSADTVLRLGGRLGSLEVGGTLSTLGDPTAQGEVTGDITFLPGSLYDVRILPTGESDIIQSGGMINIQGGMVNAMAAAGDYVAGDEFTILTGATGVNGVFDGLTEASTAFLDIELVYRGNEVLIALAADDLEDVDFTTAAGTFNQRQAATALNAFGIEEGTDSRTIVSELSFVMAPDAEAALDATSGELHASVLGAGLRAGRFLPGKMMARAASISGGRSTAERATPESESENALAGRADFGLWVAGSLIDGSLSADNNAARVNYDGYGFAAGFDWSDAKSGFIIGAAAGYQKGDSTVTQRGSQADYEGWNLGAYAAAGSGGKGFTGKLAASYAFGETDTSRQIIFGGVNRTAIASYDVDTFSLNSELRYGFGKKDSGWSFGPLATFDYAHVSRDAFAETGAGALNVAGGSDSDSLTAFGAGLFANWQDEAGRFDISVAYDYADGEFSQTRLSFEGAPGTPFDVRSPLASDSGVMAALSGEIEIGGGWRLGAGYRGRFASDNNAHSGFVSIIWR